MTGILCILTTFLLVFSHPTVHSQKLDFRVKPGRIDEKTFELEGKQTDSPSSSSSSFSAHFLAVQTSSPVSIHVSSSSGDVPQCSRMPLLESVDAVQVGIPDECVRGAKKIVFHVESKGDEASGSLKVIGIPAILRSKRAISDSVQTDRFAVSENHPFSRKIKLASLADDVEIRLSSENVENALDVYISFCETNKGILYTTSYAPNVDITLRSPRMELYYDAYSCDSHIAFYTNSSQPVSSLIVRLESQFAINGSLRVLVNGEEPSTESHVADYETGGFEVRKGETRQVELKYRPNSDSVHAFFDVTSGSVSITTSPCKNNPSDVGIGEFAVGSHRIDIDVEHLMSNTTCPLLQIDPSVVFLSLRSSAPSSTLTFWIPGAKATWHLALFIALLLLLLTAIMLLILYFGRRKTGKLVINYFQSS